MKKYRIVNAFRIDKDNESIQEDNHELKGETTDYDAFTQEMIKLLSLEWERQAKKQSQEMQMLDEGHKKNNPDWL